MPRSTSTAQARPEAVAALPAEPGVYRFRDEAGRVLYVGRATDLRRRVGSYWGALRDRPRLRRMVPQVVAVEALVCASEHEAAWVERNLLERRLPRWNRVRGGLEVPTYLQLTSSARTPGLEAVHRPATGPDVVCFGPYLGGDRARLAAAALGRVFPLAYAGRRLSGSEAEMARLRGAGPDLLPGLVAAVTAVLRREPDAVAAVRADLVGRRDAAVAGERFEVAGRLHDELAALEWVLAAQQATVDGAGDLAFAGWADGVLVRFRVRAGRLDTWEQTPAGPPEQPPVCPPGWEPFVRRNAGLAARLARLPVR